MSEARVTQFESVRVLDNACSIIVLHLLRDVMFVPVAVIWSLGQSHATTHLVASGNVRSY